MRRVLAPLMAATLFLPTFVSSTAAAPSAVACGEIIVTDVVVVNDLVCADTDGLIVGRDNVTIDLNGHTITCAAPANGYAGECVGAGPNGVIVVDPDPEVGIDTNGHNNVLVFGSGVTATGGGAGRLIGFDIGVHVSGGAEVTVKNMHVSSRLLGTVAGAPEPKPAATGILVEAITCPFPRKSIVHIGGGQHGENNVSGYNIGIHLRNASCVNLGWNTAQNSRSGLFETHGILLENSSYNNLHENGATSNGDRGEFDGGITLRGPMTFANTVTANRALQNFGDGISARDGASGNQIDNNLMLSNGFELSGTVFYDAADGPSRGNSPPPTNFWNFNNRCLTQTTPNPPPGVCAPDELPS
jgi:parallel beta-helix repeat protein